MKTICNSVFLKPVLSALVLLVALPLFLSQAGSLKGFWEDRPQLMEQVIKQRKVAVSVKVSERMKLQGVGLVNAPVSYTGPWLLKYENLKRVSSYVRELRWNPATKVLFLHTEAMGYHARMHILMESQSLPDKSQGVLVNWTVKKGFLKDLSGQLMMKKQSFSTTLFTQLADGSFQKSNIPKLFLKFGFELFVQKFAEKMRTLIESDFKSGQSVINIKEERKDNFSHG